MAILFTSIFSGIGLLWDRQFGFLKETLVAPVPRLHIMIGRTLGGATIAMIQGMLRAGRVPDRRFPAATHSRCCRSALVFMVMIAIVFAALGTAIGSTLHDMQGFQLIMNFLVMPIFFLSGALFPLNNLPTALTVATRIDPLSYGIDGLRARFIGTVHFGIATDLSVLGWSWRRLHGARRLVVLADPDLTATREAPSGTTSVHAATGRKSRPVPAINDKKLRPFGERGPASSCRVRPFAAYPDGGFR